MLQRIFRSFFFSALAVLLASILLFMNVLYSYFSDIRKTQLREQTALISLAVSQLGIAYLENLSQSSYRITWIDTDGSILFDNRLDSAKMDNHLDREEVLRAIALGYGESERFSGTLTEKYFYYAQRLSDRSVIRLSATQSSTLALLLQMQQPLFMIFGLAILLSLVIAHRISTSIVKPLNTLDLDNPLAGDGYDEISPLLHRIDRQQQEIRRNQNELLQKQLEFEAVTNNMREGILLLDSEQRILSVNRAAMNILDMDCSCIGRCLQSIHRRLDFSELLKRPPNDRYSTRTVTLDDREYLVSANPVMSGGIASGTVLLFQDIHEKMEMEQLRREFTANVSHELRTPLHTISGHSELLANSMVKAEDIPVFSKKIYQETQRLIQLVENIIQLSRLDEGYTELQREDVDIRSLAGSVAASMQAKAAENNIHLSVQGEAARVFGYPHLLHEILYNLCDNAIKYNQKDGNVIIDIRNEDHAVILSVRDNGIGIAEQYRQRVFERFFRVDKSHSKKIGGTGLGLSIVKHAAKVHNAKIDLISKPNDGTTVSVSFPK